ncbi:MAG TPA: hypothetical protein VK070_03290 [Acidimicrobiia bacterium]|jgi:hypothetical protein|nr:hypothetical protein [Acidimicrobiia bacterium]
MSPLFCRLIRTTLVARILDTGQVPEILEGHVSHCLRCQAVVAHSTRLRRTLAGLDPDLPETNAGAFSPPVGVAAVVLSLAAVAVLFRLRQQSD